MPVTLKMEDCPFCFKSEALSVERDKEGGSVCVVCSTCGARGPNIFDDMARAVNAWNQRQANVKG